MSHPNRRNEEVNLGRQNKNRGVRLFGKYAKDQVGVGR